MADESLTGAKRRLLDELKRTAPATASDLARALGLTPTAVRQHLTTLADHGLARVADARRGDPGRPAARWELTALATDLFPDRHADLTVDLIESTREALGEAGLKKVVDTHSARQLAAYRETLPGTGVSIRRRVRALARQRSREGYVAEVVADGDDLLLIEHHCPICDAATACTGLCQNELDVFRQTLGDDAVVEREQHLLSGDRRCVYRVSPA